jgi:hypothetical protein
MGNEETSRSAMCRRQWFASELVRDPSPAVDKVLEWDVRGVSAIGMGDDVLGFGLDVGMVASPGPGPRHSSPAHHATAESIRGVRTFAEAQVVPADPGPDFLPGVGVAQASSGTFP